ncbi:hypothetical protein BLNAU_23981 [Blattamonas nauphoetae]|uniref:Uncharacterized protein n=1 Tax=Blattamonas nauphoetae TaxID=2049346 RepID=A0ABQ9WNQ7_9EUKA|nr:hypothetical protein BLNAU_23981 [Blattamonas nauphoetae]
MRPRNCPISSHPLRKRRPDSEPPPPLDSPSPGPSTPVAPPPENEEWSRARASFAAADDADTHAAETADALVSVQIITHSLSLLHPAFCDDFTRLLNLGNESSTRTRASEERILSLDSTQQFTFDMSAARKGYNVGHDAELHTLLHYLAAFLMLFNEAFDATSFNLTQNPQRMETMLIVDRHDPRLN